MRMVGLEINLVTTSVVVVSMAMGSDLGNFCMRMLRLHAILYITTVVICLGAINFFARIGTHDYGKKADQTFSVITPSALNLFLPLASYTFSQFGQHVKQQGIWNEGIQLILIWLALAEIIRQQMDATCTGKLLRSTTSIRKSVSSIEQLARVGGVTYLAYSYTPVQGFVTWKQQLPSITVYSLCVISASYEILMYVAFMKAKGSYLMNKHPEIIDSHVKRVLFQDDLQTAPLECCDYIVTGEATYEIEVSHNGYQIVHNEAGMELLLKIRKVFLLRLNEDEGADWRDNCVSFALAKMLRRRFCRLPLCEAGSSKALDFVLKGLIESIPSERVFTILNGELNFLSEFLHSKALMYQHVRWLRYVDNALLHIWSGVTLLYFTGENSIFVLHDTIDKYYFGCASTTSKLTFFYSSITCLLILSCFGLQRVNNRFSPCWAPLLFVKPNVENPAVKWKKREFICPVKPTGLHSVLDIKVRSIFLTRVGRRIIEHLPKVIRQKSIGNVNPTMITADVKETVLNSLKKSEGRLTNGKSSLAKHGMMDQLISWVCLPDGSITEAILVWHIATTLFTILDPPPQHHSKERGVALALSNYCHYLVESLPGLLPDEVEWTKRMYSKLREEVQSVDCFSGYQFQLSRRYETILRAVWGENSVLGKGARLAKELMKHAEAEVPVWIMLADFWAEMMLFIAPSENIAGHEKVLGEEEFITQIWVLLTHAGILTRPNSVESVGTSPHPTDSAENIV